MTGHHHIGMFQLDSGMNLLKDLFGVKFVIEDGWDHQATSGAKTEDYVDYIAPEKSLSKNQSKYWHNSSQVIAAKRGLLLEYPNDVSEPGRILNIPNTHNTNDFVTGDVWLQFYNPSSHGRGPNPISITELPDGTKGAKDAYLSTYNNTAIIQTGHNSLATGGKMITTEDEQKVIANTIFYLAQLTTETSHKDRSGMDVVGPNKIQGLTYNRNTNTVIFPTPKDNGSTYEYYVEAIGQNDGRIFHSNIIELTNTSGLAGYSYVVDFNKDTMPDNQIETTNTSFTLDLTGKIGNYLHLAAVDKAGNISEVIHYEIDSNPPTFEIISLNEEWTNQPIQLKVINIDDKDGFGYGYTIYPDGSMTDVKNPIYTVNQNGIYTFQVVDLVGNITTKSFSVENLDFEPPYVRIQEIERTTNHIKIRFEYAEK